MLRKIIAVGLPAVVLISAILGMKALTSRQPKPRQKTKQEVLQPVKVVAAQRAPERYTIRGLGRTMPAQQVMIQPQVSGLVTKLHAEMTLGGIVKAQAPLLEVDKNDYHLAVRQAEAQVGQANVRLREEEGRQAVSAHEWELLRRDNGSEPENAAGRSLALREPQLKSAQLNLEAARASLAQARLALKRTSLTAPMNGVIVKKNVDAGQRVAPNQSVATLVGTDRWWIQVSLSPSDLRRVNVPNVKTTVYAQDPSQALDASIIRTLPDVDGAGKLVRLLIAVDDPMRLKNEGNALFLGDSVNIVFDCPTPEGLIELPRRALRSDGQLWKLTKDNTQTGDDIQGTISFVKPTIFYKSQALLLVGGLTQGDLVVNSNLSMVTQGTRVRWKQDPPSAASDNKTGSPQR
jgi:RND family efflux transporter MFP subunit